jgi:hypothetical protein
MVDGLWLMGRLTGKTINYLGFSNDWNFLAALFPMIGTFWRLHRRAQSL